MTKPTPSAAASELRGRLARLSFVKAAKLLRPRGIDRLRVGGRLYAEMAFDPGRDAQWSDTVLRLRLPDGVVAISHADDHVDRLAWRCQACERNARRSAAAGDDADAAEADGRDGLFDDHVCEHVAAAFSLILEEKTALGLAKPPPERVPVESLSEAELVERALAERAERARVEKMRVTAADPARVWTDYAVVSAASGKTHRVALRGWERGESYCSCPDFRKNTLGTCKHILRVAAHVRKKHPGAARAKPWTPSEVEAFLAYPSDPGAEPSLRLNLPAPAKRATAPAALKKERLLAPYRKKPEIAPRELVRLFAALDGLGTPARIFADAEEFVQRALLRERLAATAAEIRRDPARHPLRKTLLKTELLPYQLDGIAFAVGAGRAILADDMGLGKTIQAVGVAELLAREAGIARALVVCPASLKAQWLEEIERFSTRTARQVTGDARARAGQYADARTFFTVCNYEQILRDLPAVEAVAWDLIVLDEAQRVKNWEAATTRVVQGLKSRFALALSGTPLENRLEELYTVAAFVDDRRLGPAFRFLNAHRVADDKGRVMGYKNLRALRKNLAPIMLRRTRVSVAQQLPSRQTEIIRVEPTEEQFAVHQGHLQTVVQTLNKPFLTEMDLFRLRKALLMCRLAANDTFLVDKQPPGYSTKLERLDELFEGLLAEDGRKIIVFSEWTSMLDRIEPLLEKRGVGFARLDGSVPQKQRQALVRRFRTDPSCPVFLATNAGATGLNLQAANTVVNIDLPWNPAVLEQRIARAHRMGQKRPVQVYLLVTEQTLEERLLATLGAKRDLALAALDPDSPVDKLSMISGTEALKNRLEVLLGHPADAPERGFEAPAATRTAAATTATATTTATSTESTRRHGERLATAGGALLTAAFQFIDALRPPSAAATIDATSPGAGAGEDAIGASGDAAVSSAGAAAWAGPLAERLQAGLANSVVADAEGRPRLSLPLPDAKTLDGLAQWLTGILGGGAWSR